MCLLSQIHNSQGLPALIQNMNVVKYLFPVMANDQHIQDLGRSINRSHIVHSGTQGDDCQHNLHSAIFEFFSKRLTMQGCGELTDFAHFSAFLQCLLCSAKYKLSDLKYVF